MTQIQLISFGYKHGPVTQSHKRTDRIVRYDLRHLPNPYSDKKLRPLNGIDPEVQTWLRCHPQFMVFVQNAYGYLGSMARHAMDKGDDVYIYAGCTGGKHRSVGFIEMLAQECRTWSPGMPTPTVRHAHLKIGG